MTRAAQANAGSTGKSALWLSTTNCDNNGNAADGADKVFQIELK